MTVRYIPFLAGLLAAGLVAPAYGGITGSKSIRDRMRSILDSPEFRNLVPLKPKGRPRSFNGKGSDVPFDGEEFRRDERGNPVIVRDEKGRARIGRDKDGKAVIGQDADGRNVGLRDQEGRDFIVRDGKPDEEALRDNQQRNVIVRDGNEKARIGKDAAGRAVIGKDEFGRDVVLRDQFGRDVVVRDGKGQPGVQNDEFGRPIIFRDEQGKARIGRDQQGRAVLGKDQFGRDVVLKDGNNRDVAARHDDGRNGVLRDRQGRPVIFRDENQRANFRRDPDKRGNMGRDGQGRDVQIRDQNGRDVFVFDEKEWEKVRKFDPAEGPLGDGRRGDGNRGENGNRGRERGGDADANRDRGANRDFNAAPRDTSSSSKNDLAIQSTGFSAAMGGFLSVFAWIIVAIVAGVLLYFIGVGIVALVAMYRDRDKTITEGTETAAIDPMEPDKSPGELPADVYIQRARELASEGKFREAIAQLLLGGMSNLERAGIVKYRKGLTHRDYVRACRSQPQCYQSMKGMVRLYEPLGFGRRNPTPQHFDKALAAYEAGFRAAPSLSRQ